MINDWIKSCDAHDRAGIKVLKIMLSREPKWQKLAVLSQVIGASEEDTKELLLMAGARASAKDGESNLWGLISRNSA